MSAVSGNPPKRLMQGSLWKMKTSITGGIKWKRKWVSSDGVIVAHWHSDVLPKKATPPKHTYVLERCLVIEFKTNRPYAFKIKDRKSKDEIAFACDSVTEYASWLSFLTDDKSVQNSEQFAVESAPSHTEVEEHLKPLSPASVNRSGSPSRKERPVDPRRLSSPEDSNASETASGYNDVPDATNHLIRTFFQERNTRMAEGLSIRSSEFWDLMKTLDEAISINAGRQAIASLSKKSGIILLHDFLHWWRNRFDVSKPFNSGTSNILRSHIGLSSSKRSNDDNSKSNSSEFRAQAPGNNGMYAGMLDIEMIIPENNSFNLLQSSPFMKQNLPDVKNVLTEWSLQPFGFSWNERIQTSIENVLEAQNRVYEFGEEVDKRHTSSLLESYFQYFAVLGSFYSTARAGTETIINEYSLPDHLRRADLVNKRAYEAEDSAGGGVAHSNVGIDDEEIFILDGLIYRLVAIPSSTRDLEGNSSDVFVRFVTATDTIKHKIIGNDTRAWAAVQNAIFSLFPQAATTHSYVHPCTIMQTIIDYGGYRVQVMCPLYLEEKKTLKYGHAPVEDIFICRDMPESDAGVPYIYPKIFQEIAEKLNLRQRVLNTVVSDQAGADNIENVHVYESSELVLTSELQLHQSSDNRFYIVNFGNLFPPDLPRAESNDVLTRHFRPEFVSHYRRALTPEALSIEAAGSAETVKGFHAVPGDLEHINLTGAENHDVLFDKSPEHTEGYENRVRKPSLIAQNATKLSVETVLMAARVLRTETIPDVTKRLDSMVVFPLGSYGITRLIHGFGINCRYLGLIYEQSRIFHVRQMILCEVIARSVKVLLKQILQRSTRQGKAESCIAEERGRSKEAHFMDHQEKLLQSKRAAVVDLFNLVLGFGAKSEELWNGVLRCTIKVKFDLELPSVIERSTLVYGYQLFEALQYHCGVVFKDSNGYKLLDPTVTSPFCLDDLVSYLPVVKANILFPGVGHDLFALATRYMKEKMYSDALNALRIQLSAVILAQGSRNVEKFLSVKYRSVCAQITYNIALCHYYMKQYDAAFNVLLAHLESSPKYSVIAARMLTLVMYSCFMSSSSSTKINSALQYFEAARVMYYLTLGAQHPVHGYHITALADLYFSQRAYAQAKFSVMIAQNSFRNALGDMHPVCAGVSCKLGNLLLSENQYSAAAEIFEGAFSVYQHINRQNSGSPATDAIHVYCEDEAHCLHGLAVALRGKNEISYAMQCAVLSIDILTSENRPVTPGFVSTLLLLAEMYESTSDLYTSVALYQDVWNIVKANPHVFPMSTMCIDLAGRMVRVLVDMLPLQSKTLIDTIVAEGEVPNKSDWDIAVNKVINELWHLEPVAYVRDTIKQALEEAGTTGMFSLASRLDNISQSKASGGVIGVPFSSVDLVLPVEVPSSEQIAIPAKNGERLPRKTLQRAMSERDSTLQRKSNILGRSSSAGGGMASIAEEYKTMEYDTSPVSKSPVFSGGVIDDEEHNEDSDPVIPLIYKLRALLMITKK